MASKVQVILVDDIDGGEADETINFALDGAHYEIDLADKNAEALREALEPFRKAARRIRGNRAGGSRATVDKGFMSADRAHIKTFAERNGLPVPSDRGRISSEVLSKWNEAGKPRY